MKLETYYIKSNDGSTFHYVLTNNKKITICNNQTIDDPNSIGLKPPQFRRLCNDCRIIYNIVLEQLNS